jgi:hypothetical protein
MLHCFGIIDFWLMELGSPTLSKKLLNVLVFDKIDPDGKITHSL